MTFLGKSQFFSILNISALHSSANFHKKFYSMFLVKAQAKSEGDIALRRSLYHFLGSFHDPIQIGL